SVAPELFGLAESEHDAVWRAPSSGNSQSCGAAPRRGLRRGWVSIVPLADVRSFRRESRGGILLHQKLRTRIRLSARLGVRAGFSQLGQVAVHPAVGRARQNRHAAQRSRQMTRVAFLFAAAAVSATVVVSPVRRAPLLFGEGDHWVLVDDRTKRAVPISFPLSNIDNVAVSNDGKTFALIAPDASHAWAVWIWNRGEASARVLFADGGRYSDPAFDPEGRWIYFSHSISG